MKYVIYWSDDDECWICECGGVKGHGSTAMDALAHAMEATIAVLTVQEEEKPEPPPLSVIMDRSLWWLDDTNIWRAVDSWDIETNQFHLSEPGYYKWVSRDWFTGRKYRKAEEFGG